MIRAIAAATCFALAVMPATAKTERDVFSAAAIDAARTYSVDVGTVQIRIVPRHHEMLGGVRHARSVVYVSGKRVLFVSDRLPLKPSRFQNEVLQHEFSHFAAWDAHGFEIPEHGNAWRKTCLNSASSKDVCDTIR